MRLCCPADREEGRHRADQAPAPTSPRPASPHSVQETRGQPGTTPAGRGIDHRRPAPHRQETHTQSRVRLRRRRCGSRDIPGPGATRVRRTAVQSSYPARCLDHRYRLGSARETSRAAIWHRPHGLHPHDANRRRARRRGRRSRCRDSFRPVHHGNHLDRGCRRRGARRPQLVPAVHVEGPGPLDGACRPGGQGRLRYPARHCRRPRRRSAAARPAERLHHPAPAHRPHHHQCAAPPGLVV